MLVKNNCSRPIRRDKTRHIELIDMQPINPPFVQDLANSPVHRCPITPPHQEGIACYEALEEEMAITPPGTFHRNSYNPMADLEEFLGALRLLFAPYKGAVDHLVLRGQVAQHL